MRVELQMNEQTEALVKDFENKLFTIITKEQPLDGYSIALWFTIREMTKRTRITADVDF